MSVKQISVFLENKPGQLNKMTKVLADKGINMRAISLAETKDFGIVRMITDNLIEATTVLKEADFIASLTPVLVYRVPDEPGGLNRLLQAFSEAEVNLEYMYAAPEYMVFRVANTEKSEAAVASRGFRSLSQEELSEE